MKTKRSLQVMQKLWNGIVIFSMVFSQLGWAVGKASALGPPLDFNKTSPADAVIDLAPSGLNLTWESSSGADTYEYCIDSSGDSICDGDNWISTGASTSVTLDLTAGTTYYWQVRAVNAMGLTYATYANVGTWWSFSTANATPYECTDPIGCINIGPTDPLHIAYALVTSGSSASLGIDSRNGIELAIDDSGGQILGHDILFDGLDEECSPEGGAAAGATLAADPSIVAVIGTSCSGAARTAMPALSAAGMVMVSPSNTGFDLTEPGNPNNFPGYYRTSISDTLQGAAAAQFAYNFLGITTAATIDEGSGYSDSLQAAFVNEFEGLGGIITSSENLSEEDISTALANISTNSPALIYFPIFMPQAADVINQVHSILSLENATLMGSDALYTPEVVTATGANVEGFLVTGWDTTQYNPNYKDIFLPAYQLKFGTPPINLYHAQAYDAFMMIKAAIEQVAETDAEGILHIGRQALRTALYGTTDFNGLTGTLTCSATGDCADNYLGAFRYHAGQSEPLKIWPDVTTPEFSETNPVSVTMSQNGTPDAFSLTLHASDGEETLTWSISTGAQYGTASVSDPATGGSMDIHYSPNTDFAGADTFVVQVDDGLGGLNRITVNVTVNPNGSNANFWVFIPMNGSNPDIQGYNWPMGIPVTMTYEDLVTPHTYTSVASMEDHGGFTNIIFDTTGITVHPGDVVTLDNGTTTLTHTVTSLHLTQVDLLDNSVHGTAAVGSNVSAGINWEGGNEYQEVTAD